MAALFHYLCKIFSKTDCIIENNCIFAMSFYHTAQVTKTVSVDVFDSDEHTRPEITSVFLLCQRPSAATFSFFLAALFARL